MLGLVPELCPRGEVDLLRKLALELALGENQVQDARPGPLPGYATIVNCVVH